MKKDKNLFIFFFIVLNSPTDYLDGKIRPVDDYMPRTQIKKYFSRKKLETAKEIEEFSRTFVVSEDLVKTYVKHLKHLEFLKSLRNKATTEKRQNREAKTYEDYNWNKLVLTGGLSSFYVGELNTYLKKHLLPWKKNLKNEKITTIATHLKETMDLYWRL